MPQGYEWRTHSGSPVKHESLAGHLSPFSRVVSPVTGFDAVYTYRSGKRSKDLLLERRRDPFSSSGNLLDDLSYRKAYLENLVEKITVDPPVGSPTVFSQTDVGHPFASLKIRTFQPNNWIRSTLTATRKPYTYCDGFSFVMGNNPAPNTADPFGISTISVPPYVRWSSKLWPANMPFAAAVPSAQQVMNQSLHKSLGSGLIAASNPWAPKASLAVTIMELLTGDVPSVLKNLRRYLADLQSLKRTAGSDWLNVQFGWVPLVSDIMAAVDVLFKLHLLLHESNERRRGRSGDLGTWSRVNDSAPGVSDRNPILGSVLGNDILSQSGNYNSPPNISTTVGRWSRTFTVTANYRFTARYHRGTRPNQAELGYLDRAVELLGLEMTPDVLWQLTPWTWLLDWGSNLGAISKNLSTLDWSNVLLDYAYLTYRIDSRTSMTATIPGSWVSGSYTYETPKFLSSSVTVVEKIREQASPFGFSVSWDGLSPFQLSILAALGMSRGR